MEKVTSFDKPQDVVVLNKLLGSLDNDKAAMSFGATVPTDLNNGQFFVYDNGVTRELYVKTIKGTLCKITLTVVP
jgi:hypothetical protein